MRQVLKWLAISSMIFVCTACNYEGESISGGDSQMSKENINTQALEEARSIAQSIEEGSKKPVIKMRIVEGTATGLFESKIGGTPYIPHDGQIPRDADGVQMKLIAQIDCTSLGSLEDFPKQGLLQFFAGTDDATGLDFDDQTSGRGSKVVYYETVDATVTEEEVLFKTEPLEKDMYFPIEGSYPITFSAEEEGMSMGDYQYEQLFINRYNTQFEGNDISSIYDLDEEIFDALYESQNEFGHKIGGYPAFTQTDPRKYNQGLRDYDTLLLQIDSEYDSEKCEIMWGDGGICNFFIRSSELQKLDFSKVLYNWDCY